MSGDYQQILGTASFPIDLTRNISFLNVIASARGDLRINVELQASIITRHGDDTWEAILEASAIGDFRAVVNAFGSEMYKRDFNLSKSITLMCFFNNNTLERIQILSDNHNPILEIAVFKFLQFTLKVSMKVINSLIMVAYKIVEYAKLLISYLTGAVKDFAHHVSELIEIGIRGAIAV